MINLYLWQQSLREMLVALLWISGLREPAASREHAIQWGACENDFPMGVDCGSLNVPLDWSNPGGQQITLSMTRIKATDQSARKGTLYFGQGGPGVPARQVCASQLDGSKSWSDELTKSFDILCVDPRGVGNSSPVLCNMDLYNKRQTLFPADEEAYNAMVAANKAFGESCLRLSGDIVKFVDTTSAVHDVEAVRVALGEGKLNFLGISYGTQMGYQYAELYPENVGMMVLDGNLDHTESAVYTVSSETYTYEDSLARFFEWCTSSEDCPLDGSDMPSRFKQLVTNANIKPIPAPACWDSADASLAGYCYPNVTGEDITFTVQNRGYLTARESWSRLGHALNQTFNGNASLLSSYSASKKTWGIWQGLVIGCLDWNRATSFADNKYMQLMGNATVPLARGASQSYTYNTQCIGWPVPTTNGQRALNQTAMKLAPPILMVNANHDPETSYVWAQNLLPQIPSAVLLTRNGDGHTSYGLFGESSRLIDAYLVNGTLPQPGTVVDT